MVENNLKLDCCFYPKIHRKENLNKKTLEKLIHFVILRNT